MNKIKNLLVLLFLLLAMPTMVNAAGGISVSKSNISLNVGKSTSFTIKANNAAGRVDVSTSNSPVATISKTSEFLDNSSVTITVKGVSVGSATITVKATDMATYDSEDLSGKTYTIKVNVSEPSAPVISNKSGNNNLKKIEIEGYFLKQESGNYTLTVGNSVGKIKINAEAEDSKATVSGTGEQALKVGDNTFTVSVKAENGNVKKYNVIVTRKDDRFYLNDIDEFIKSGSDTLLLESNQTLTKDVIDKLKPLNKEISLIKVDSNNNALYKLIFNTNKLSSAFNTNISFTSKNKVEELTNYTEGISIIGDKNLPKDTTISVNTNNKYSNDISVNVYEYKNGKLELLNTTKVKNNEVSFKASNSEEYFITRANLDIANNKGINIFIIISIIELIIIVLLFLNIKKDKFNKNNI